MTEEIAQLLKTLRLGRIAEIIDDELALAEHRPARGEGRPKNAPPPEEQEILQAEPELTSYVSSLKQRGGGTPTLRRLRRLLRDYPRAPLLAAVRVAAHYGLYDLYRLERMVLRNIATEYFVAPVERRVRDDEEPDDEG